MFSSLVSKCKVNFTEITIPLTEPQKDQNLIIVTSLRITKMEVT